MAAVPSIGRADRARAPAREADLTRTLYEQYANQIFRYCLHQLGSREEAEDAVQSTFLNAFRGIKRGIVPEAESAWLFKIAHNVCLSRRRSTWRRDRIESPADFELVEELAPAPGRRADELIGLQDALEELPESQRRAILLREWQGLSYREIGEELGLTQAAVETLIFRARRSLAQGLENPQETKKRRFRGADLGNLLGALKTMVLGGGAGAVKVAATVAVVSATTVVASAPVQSVRHHHSTPAAAASSSAAVPAVPVSPLAVSAVRRAAPAGAGPTFAPAAHLAVEPAPTTPSAAAPAGPAPSDTVPSDTAPPVDQGQAASSPSDTAPAAPAAPPAQLGGDGRAGDGKRGGTSDTPSATTEAAKDGGSGSGGGQGKGSDKTDTGSQGNDGAGRGQGAGSPGPRSQDNPGPGNPGPGDAGQGNARQDNPGQGNAGPGNGGLGNGSSGHDGQSSDAVLPTLLTVPALVPVPGAPLGPPPTVALASATPFVTDPPPGSSGHDGGEGGGGSHGHGNH